MFSQSQNNYQVQKFCSENFFSNKFNIKRNILFSSPTDSLQFIKTSRRFAIWQNLKVDSLLAFSVKVFVILKVFLFLVYIVCTIGISMPLFSSFRPFETSNRSLNRKKIGSVNMFNNRSWLFVFCIIIFRYPFDLHPCLLPAPFCFGLPSSQSLVGCCELPSSLFAQPEFQDDQRR